MIVPLSLTHLNTYDTASIYLQDNFSLNGLSYDPLIPFVVLAKLKIYNTDPILVSKDLSSRFYTAISDTVSATENSDILTCLAGFPAIDMYNDPYIYMDQTNLIKPYKVLEIISDTQIRVGTTFTAIADYTTLIYYRTIKILGTDFTASKSAIPSGVYTINFYTDTTAPNTTINYTMNIVYYSSLAACIRQKLNEFVLDCNQCKSPDSMMQFFIAESMFMALQNYENGVLDPVAINKILASLNTFCNQNTCRTC